MFGLTHMQIQPIGIDIGRDAVKMLQLAVVGNHLAVRASAHQALSPEVRASAALRVPAAVDVIRALLRRGRFAGRRAVVALPREIVHIKNIRLPLMPASDLEQAIQFEAKQLFPFDTDAAQVRFLPAGEVRQGTDVLQEVVVLAANNQDIDNFVEQMHRAGVLLESLDVEPAALYRSIERFIRRREDEQEVHVLVDVGYGCSKVVIGKGREIALLKVIDIGSAHLHEAISKKLSISLDEAQQLRRRQIESPVAPEAARKDPVRQAVIDATRSPMEQLGREISLCLRYWSVTFRGHRPMKLRLVGGEAGDPLLQSVLQPLVMIPVEAARPLYSVDVSAMPAEDRQGTMSQWALALGLSLRQTTKQFAPRDGRSRASQALPAAIVEDETAIPVETPPRPAATSAKEPSYA